MHSKKRPNGLTWVRCFNGQVLDMIEIGLEKAVPMSEFKVSLSAKRGNATENRRLITDFAFC